MSAAAGGGAKARCESLPEVSRGTAGGTPAALDVVAGEGTASGTPARSCDSKLRRTRLGVEAVDAEDGADERVAGPPPEGTEVFWATGGGSGI
jgi:hypothetical protein